MVRIDKLTLCHMIDDPDYSGLSDGLIQLPVPDTIKIKKKICPVPKDMKELSNSICYGQRLFMTRKEDNDFGCILRAMDGYFYPLATVNKWDEDKALLFGKYILPLQAIELYPVAMHIITLVSEMVEREKTLLHREPTKLEIAAGIEKLNVYSELTSLDFLRDAMKCTTEEALLTPYNECLVRFMIAKDTADYQTKYFDLLKTANEPIKKHK